MSEFQIQPLAPTQIPAVSCLFAMQLAEHAVERSQTELTAGLTTLLAEPAQGFVFVAVAGEKPIGVAYVARILSLEHGGWSGWLDELYARPEWRNRGVGSALLAAAIAAATEREWAALDLEVDTDHRRVISLYQRNFFRPVSRTRFVRRLN
ncbi:MAG: GNAT family N-acetyltransferase [Chthoniobacterales bacterium]|nr:GNAT family N-acetyltransferase [Chthoniobacterales bacterium]